MDNNSFARLLFIGAAACGAVHAEPSLYWASGGGPLFLLWGAFLLAGPAAGRDQNTIRENWLRKRTR